MNVIEPSQSEVQPVWDAMSGVDFVASGIMRVFQIFRRILTSSKVEDVESVRLQMARLIHGMSTIRDVTTAAWTLMTLSQTPLDSSADPISGVRPYLSPAALSIYSDDSFMGSLNDNYLRRPWPSLSAAIQLDLLAVSAGVETRAVRTLSLMYLSLCAAVVRSTTFNMSGTHVNMDVVCTLLAKSNHFVADATAADASAKMMRISEIYVGEADSSISELLAIVRNDSNPGLLGYWFGRVRDALKAMTSDS
jgi:hypothetical protein